MTATWSEAGKERAREMVAVLNAEYERRVAALNANLEWMSKPRVAYIDMRLYRNRAARRRSRMRRRGGR